MPYTQPGALYKNAAHIERQDRLLGEALSDIASQVAAARNQGNFGTNAPPDPPSAPAALHVSATTGLLTATVLHSNAPAGTQYVLQYSTTTNFKNAISELLTHTPAIPTTWQKALPAGAKYYLRVAAKFPASNLGSWVYFGTAAAPAPASI